MSGLSSVLDEILERADSHANDAALVDINGRQLTYGELARQVKAASSRLDRHGIQPGDRVLFSIRPSIAAIVLILATARTGAAIVAADPGMGAELFHSRMKLARVTWAMAESTLYFASSSPIRSLVRVRGLDIPRLHELNLRHVRVGPWLPWVPAAIPFSELIRPLPGPSANSAARGSDAPAFIVFTSGTTDAPRAVVHTDASLGATLHMISRRAGLQHGDVVYTDQLHSIVPALQAGATVVIPPRRCRPRKALDLLHHYRVTHLFAVPFELERIVEYCAANGVTFPNTLQTIVVGAATVRPTFLQRLRRVVSPRTAVWSVYATTEMLPICVASLDEKLQFSGVGDLVGRPDLGVSVRITDDGELLVSGPNLCHSYLGLPAHHMVATGDLAYLDSAGRVVLLGRKKDMIVRGHHNIYPALYEEAVLAIEGVRGCAFVGVYDDEAADERVVLVVEPMSGVDRARLVQKVRHELRNGEHRIDSWAQPDHILFMDLTVSGRSRKLDRAALRRWVGQVLP